MAVFWFDLKFTNLDVLKPWRVDDGDSMFGGDILS